MTCATLIILLIDSMVINSLREYSAYFAYCRIFRIFQQRAHIAYFPAQIGIYDSNFNIICISVTYFY